MHLTRAFQTCGQDPVEKHTNTKSDYSPILTKMICSSFDIQTLHTSYILGPIILLFQYN